MEKNTKSCCSRITSKLTIAAVLTFFTLGIAVSASAQSISYDLYGYRANEGGGGAISTPWTKGNLGNTWSEGEWVPYMFVVENPAGPAFADADSFIISFDFTRYGGGDYARFVDLIRSIQVGTVMRNDDQGWVQSDGSAFPDGTREQIEIAQNDPGEYAWTGFTLLNLPNSQINLTLTGGTDTPTGEDRHIFYIKRTDLPIALQDAPTLVFYWQLHESRTFVWQNSLQDQYDQSPTDVWGGWLYGTDGWPSEATVGSGYVPGSSGHIHLEEISGSKDVPIPIPERLPGAVDGLKFLDADGDSTYNAGDSPLEGWRIYVSGMVENIMFETSTLTDPSGIYSFPYLTAGTWTLSEADQREVPGETGYMQTYTNALSPDVGVGSATSIATAGRGPWGWEVELTLLVTAQGDMNFGNKLCELTCQDPPDTTVECTDSTDPDDTGWPTIDYNCGPIDTSYSDNVSGTCPTIITRTWTFTDAVGNTCISDQIITVQDTTAPQITCPPNITFDCVMGDAGTATATDNCDSNVDITYSDNVSGFCPTVIERTWTATDSCGNSDFCVQTITIQDTTAPQITCPPNVTFDCVMGDAGTATATDNCDPNPSVSYSDNVSGECPTVIERTWTATDSCGNSDFCVQTITIQDTTAPQITCPPDIAFDCVMGDAGTATATDNCDSNPSVSYSDNVSGECPTVIERTWTATDSCGNSDFCVQTITIQDTTAPQITCPPDIAFDCVMGDAGTATATDNCDSNPSVSYSDNVSGECPTVIERTWTATDSCGNSDFCVQTITIQDTTAPQITCPPNATFDCVMGDAGTATATDNCDSSPSVSYSDNTTGFCPTVIERTWTATDSCGNSDFCVQTITIQDTTAPEITCPPNATFDCVMGDPGTATATDNCDPNPVIGYNDNVMNARCPVIIERTWSATDSCGNVSYCVQTITIEDDTPPALTCPADITFDCEMGDAGTASATDNCDPNPTVGYNDVIVNPSCPLIIERTWYATDSCDNYTECTQTITVQDTEAPVITCAPDEVIACDQTADWTPPTATDNCDPNPVITMVYTDVPNGPGVYMRGWAATDLCGNTSDTCYQTITVEPCPCTFTIGGWGSTCPGVDPEGQPGCIRDNYWDVVFGVGGSVMIGHPDGYTATWTSSLAVENFLPAGGTPGVLDQDYVDPLETSANVLASQILALRLNVEYSCAGIFSILGFPSAGDCYGNALVPESCANGLFNGMTVSEFLALADSVVAGINTDYTPSEVNYTATCLNEFESDCDPYAPTSAEYEGDLIKSARPTAGNIPTVFSLGQNYPNPFNPRTDFEFGIPTGSHVTLDIFNIMGQKVTRLVDGYYEPGMYTVTWDGTNSASGVYFYRIEAGEYIEMRKMLLLK